MYFHFISTELCVDQTFPGSINFKPRVRSSDGSTTDAVSSASDHPAAGRTADTAAAATASLSHPQWTDRAPKPTLCRRSSIIYCHYKHSSHNQTIITKYYEIKFVC